MKAILAGRDNAHVGVATIPPLDPLPEVLEWGARVFILRAHPAGELPTYVEGMSYDLNPFEVDPGPVV